MKLGSLELETSTRKVFPFYIVCDVSKSMWSDEQAFNPGPSLPPHAIIEQALPDMLLALEEDPTAGQIAHLSVVAFGDGVTPVLPLTSLDADPIINALPREIETNYAKVFHALKEQIGNDLTNLHSLGCQTYTPVVFFLTDGNPQVGGQVQHETTWTPHREALGLMGSISPIVVALGFGNVTRESLLMIRSEKPLGQAYLAKSGAVPGELVSALLDSILFSVTHSSSSGQFDFKTPPGMEKLG